MPPHRTTAPLLLLVFAAAAAVFATAAAAYTSSLRGPRKRLDFPVVGRVAFSDDFGTARGAGGHQGNDILAARRSPVVAVEAGTVERWTQSASAGCMLYLHGASGTMYEYVHLNDDLTRGNDNRGRCVDGVAFATRLRDGQRVRAGELIGYVGDSGDAEGTHPHLHFELHPNDGAAVSPYRWLLQARRLRTPQSVP